MIYRERAFKTTLKVDLKKKMKIKKKKKKTTSEISKTTYELCVVTF